MFPTVEMVCISIWVQTVSTVSKKVIRIGDNGRSAASPAKAVIHKVINKVWTSYPHTR